MSERLTDEELREMREALDEMDCPCAGTLDMHADLFRRLIDERNALVSDKLQLEGIVSQLNDACAEMEKAAPSHELRAALEAWRAVKGHLRERASDYMRDTEMVSFEAAAALLDACALPEEQPALEAETNPETPEAKRFHVTQEVQ